MSTFNNCEETQQDSGPITPGDRNSRARFINQRPLEVDAHSEVYNMNRNVRKAVVFNHNSFTYDGWKERTGTEHDVERLRTVLKLFNFTVVVHNDLTHVEILQQLDKLRTSDHNDCDCLAIFVLTHGTVNYLASKDKDYCPDELWKYFSSTACPSMAGKPKLIVINACRGGALDYGTEFVADLTTDGPNDRNDCYQIVYNLPNNADILVAYSTFDGYISHRPEDGSWFIQTLCDVLSDDRYNKMEIKQILTRVSRMVSLMKSEKQTMQVPVVVSTLIRDLYLR